MKELPPNNILRAIYATGAVEAENGETLKAADFISPAAAAALYRTVRKYQPKQTIEIGMAYGLSTLSILTALEENGNGGRLISIDPAQSADYRNIGRLNVQRAGLADRHEVIEQKSYIALPALLANNTRVDFGYIDGWHTFDYALLDFFYLDKMLPVGGVIGFNDCGWQSVHRVLKFVRTHRKYIELDVGLPKRYRGRNLLYSAARILQRRSSSDRYFRKTEDGEPDWNFYKSF